MLQVVHHAGVLDGHVLVLKSVVEVVGGALLSSRLRHAQLLEEFKSVLVAVVNSDVLAVDLDVLPDHEVINTQKVDAVPA